MNDSPRALRDLQAWFQRAMLAPDEVAGDQVVAAIEASSKQSSAQRLAIYQRAYTARLVECLQGMFPATLQVLGDEAFAGLALAYLQQHPPSSYTLNALADHWIEFLRMSRPARQGDALDWADFLIDLARLEQAIDDVFDGPGSEGQAALSVDALRTLAAEQAGAVRIKLAPSVRLLTFDFSVNDYYTLFRQHDETPPLPPPQPTWLMLHRLDYVVQRWPLIAPQHTLLTALQQGERLDGALAAAMSADPESALTMAEQLPAWFQDWAAAGIFLAIA